MKEVSRCQGDSSSPSTRSVGLRVVLLLLGAVSLLIGFYLLYRGRILDHGTLNGLKPFYLQWLMTYVIFGLLAILLLARAGVLLGELPRVRNLTIRFQRYSGLRFVVLVSLFAVALAAFWRDRVFLEMPMTDDEAAYRFTAELLASGRLWTESPPLKIFFDQSFLVNDGKYYSQYFIGWPALLVPFVAVGLGGWLASLLHGVGVAGIYFLTVRILASEGVREEDDTWPKVAAILTMSSPLLWMTAATMLSHAACFAALVWCGYFLVRAREPMAPARLSALVSLLFCVAFFVRPQSALPVGGPLLVWWLMGIWRRVPAVRFRHLVCFSLTAMPFAVVFLAVQYEQTGSPWLPAYVRVHEYAAENHFRFTHFEPGGPFDVETNGWIAELQEQAIRLSQGILRFNFAAFGWPCSFLLALLGLGCRRVRPWLVCLAASLALCLVIPDPGVDVLGPVHYVELILPLAVATTLGVRHLVNEPGQGAAGRWISRTLGPIWPVPLLLACIVVSLSGYLPVRARSQQALAENIRLAFDAAEVHGVERGIIFSTRWFVRHCLHPGTRGFVQWWPVNDPEFENPVLYANHITLEDDRRLQREFFPDRPGYLLAWTKSCEARLLPLELDLTPVPVGTELPNGLAGQPDAEEQGWLE